MSCKHTFDATLGRTLTLAAVCAASFGLFVGPVGGQTPPPGSPPRPYRAPTLALAQPADGGTVAVDKPIIVFRFVAGEPDDAIDVRSFVVAIDGVDRSPSFQIDPGTGTAWGPLGAPSGSGIPAGSSRTGVALGPHRGTARICSLRGTCTTAAFTVSVAAPISAQGATTATPPTTKRSLMGAITSGVLQAIRSLVTP